MNKAHIVEKIDFTDDVMSCAIDGEEYKFNLAAHSKLYKASMIQKKTYEVSPSGYGIHWTLIDEDLSINGLLGIKPIEAFSRSQKLF